MKRMLALMLAVAVTALAISCTKKAEETPEDTAPAPQNAGADTITLRVVDGAADGTLVLAGKTAGEVYTLPLEGLTLYLDGSSVDASAIEDGMSAEVWYTGGVQETFPMRFTSVMAVSFSRETDGGVYDLCGLYLRVLEDLWNADEGLNGGAQFVSVDLSCAPGGLTDGEKAAVAWTFAGRHEAKCLTMTLDELREEGYLAAEKLKDGSTAYSFPEGLLFTIAPDDGAEEENASAPTVCFRAEKWRSPLGAYFFSGCQAVCTEDGRWNGYSIGMEAIS